MYNGNSVVSIQLVLKLKKKELLKSRIEERDRARKIAAEQRAELHKKEEEQTEQKHRRRKGKRFVCG